jgi:hypothetical protein
MTAAWAVGAASVCLGAALLAAPCLAAAVERTDVEVVGLAVDAMAEPLGLDVATPRLSWRLQRERGFREPPDSAKPRVWWHWLNGNVTKEGITAGLEWMKRVGIAGMQMFG